MGYDRKILPPDRDEPDTYPWKGVVAAIVIIGGILLAAWFLGVFGG